MAIEVHSTGRWLPLGETPPPAVEESRLFLFRHVPVGGRVSIGTATGVAGADGEVSLPIKQFEDVRGHIGLVEVLLDGETVGELSVVPDKMSEAAYVALRADLERVWRGLAFDPSGISRISQGPPPAGELAGRIAPVLHAVFASPHEVLAARQVVTHLHQVRRASELTPGLALRGRLGLPALATTAHRSAAPEERNLVHATLRRLLVLAHREGDERTAARVLGWLRQGQFLDQRPRRPARITWGMLSDSRYRRLLDVYRVLDRPELEPVDGPGELRAGVKGLSRLFEYWVFLQVLLVARARLGEPLGDGFDRLARHRGDAKVLDLAPGTTVHFPGKIAVAFEPTLRPDPASSWAGVEYVPHPEPRLSQSLATPDVVILHSGPAPWMVVLDAKYVGRHWVERAAAEVHAKYARARVGGRSVVRDVLAVHPHVGLSARWAGYGHLWMSPGEAIPRLPISFGARVEASSPSVAAAVSPPPERPDGAPTAAVTDAGSAIVVVVDQWWTREWIGPRRVDLDEVVAYVSGGRSVVGRWIVMPRLAQLNGFEHVLRSRGWKVVHQATPDRASGHVALAHAVRESASEDRGIPVVISEDAELFLLLQAAGAPFEMARNLADFPDLGPQPVDVE